MLQLVYHFSFNERGKKMKKILSIMGIIIVFVLGIYTNVFATGRLVDIPVPPDNHGMADFTEEEAAELDRQYISYGVAIAMDLALQERVDKDMLGGLEILDLNNPREIIDFINKEC